MEIEATTPSAPPPVSDLSPAARLALTIPRPPGAPPVALPLPPEPDPAAVASESAAGSESAAQSEPAAPPQPVVCRDCQTELVGEYCHNCGEPSPAAEDFSVKAMFGEVFEELTDFDSKLYLTFRHLLFRPGLLSSEFLAGRRRNYIRPVKLFLIIAAIHLFVVTHETGAGYLKVDFLMQHYAAAESVVDAKAAADKVDFDELGDLIDERAETIYSGSQYLALAITGALSSLLFRKKGWPYASHLLFAMHLYCFRYLFASPTVPLADRYPILFPVLFGANLVYMFLAVRRVYEPTWAGLIIKTLILYVSVFAQGAILMFSSLLLAYWLTVR